MPFTAALAGDLSLIGDMVWSANVAVLVRARARGESDDAEQGTETSVAAGNEAVASTAAAWQAVESAGGASSPFQTHAVAERLAAAHAQRGDKVRIAVVRDCGRPVVVFPTVVSRWGGATAVRFLGDPLIQYGDLVAAPQTEFRHLEAAWRAAADPSAAPMIYLRKVRADARIAPLVQRLARPVAEREAPFVDVNAAPAANARNARELRRFRRRLSEVGELRFEVRRGVAAQASVREAIDLKLAWLQSRGLTSRVIGDATWERALLSLCETPGLCTAHLWAGDRTAAIEIGFVHGAVWHAFLGAIAPDMAKAGPGHVQMEETIGRCRAAGLATYDLLAPADNYKRSLAHGSVTICDYAAALRYSGWLGLWAARAIPAAKGLTARLPAPVRRILCDV